jgi:hypothetical protein
MGGRQGSCETGGRRICGGGSGTRRQGGRGREGSILGVKWWTRSEKMAGWANPGARLMHGPARRAVALEKQTNSTVGNGRE